MQKRTLGGSGLSTGPLIFGGNVLGWTLDEEQSFAMLDAWLDAGFNMIDSADSYSRWAPGHQGGESEAILGRWFKARGNRDKVVLATKVGMEMGEGRKGLSKKYILQAVEDSLRRLQTDYIDLYFSHIDDPATPLEETLEAYQQLVEQGKVRAIGASNYSSARLEEALKVADEKSLPRYTVLQPFYNLYDRHEFEKDLAPLCQREHLGVMPYFSLGSGFLTGKYRSREDAQGRARESMVDHYFNARGIRILGSLDQVAEATKSSPATVALAWLLAQPTVTAPIVSATSMIQLEQLAEAASLQLDKGMLDELNSASA